MPDHNPFEVLLLGLIATLLIAAVGFYQWRRRFSAPSRAANAEPRQKAAEALWAKLEDANFRMRDSATSSQTSVSVRLRDVNAIFAKNARHLDDPVKASVKAYVTSLQRAAALLRDNEATAAVDWVDSTIMPIACGDARLVSALQDLARQREVVKRALLGERGC